MAGSLKWTRYVTDDGQLWGLIRDESNVEGVVIADGDTDIPTGTTTIYATFKSQTTVKTRKNTIPSRAQYDALASNNTAIANRVFTDADLGETFELQSLTPERLRPVVFSQDTGLNDGDAT
jgi:hypothetical protein